MSQNGFEVRKTDFTEPEVRALVEFHLAGMYETSPADGVFALGLEALQQREITGFAAWDGARLLGIGALKDCAGYGEIKSMRSAPDAAGKGIGSVILNAIERCAKARGMSSLKLETGPPPHFNAANRFYEKHDYSLSGPFGDYVEDPHSVFMEKRVACPASTSA